MKKQKSATFAKNLNINTLMIKIIVKLNTGKYRGAAHNICNGRQNIPNQIPVLFHNASGYDYHFIIKELAIEGEQEFDCLEENIQKNAKSFQFQ